MFATLLLKILPLKGYLIAAAAAVVLGIMGGQYVRIQHLERNLATVEAEYEHQRVDAAMAGIKASEAQRDLEALRITKQRKADDEAQHQVAIARADAAAALRSAGSLRDRYAAALAALRQAGGDPRPDAGGPAAASAVALLADVQQRIDAAAGQLAAVADERGAAGLACEREYDALTP